MTDESNPNQATTPDASEVVDVRRLIRRGHKMYWTIVAINFAPIAVAVAAGQEIPSPGLASSFYMALLYFLWRGHGWAKWVMVVIYALLSVPFVVIAITQLNLTGLAIGLVCAFIPVLLLTKSMKAWLDYQKFPYNLEGE